MIPLREPVIRVVIRAALMKFLREIALVFGLTLDSARERARSVLADDDLHHPDRDASDPAKKP